MFSKLPGSDCGYKTHIVVIKHTLTNLKEMVYSELYYSDCTGIELKIMKKK